jgi:hypothetical protein
MAGYLITGPNGSGKSTTGHELANRGFTVIEADHEPGISVWTDMLTGEPVAQADLPPYPFPEVWLENHKWLWNKGALHQLINNQPQDVFIVGGAHNQSTMYDLFDKWFSLRVPSEVMKRRLQSRGEGQRWSDTSPELARALSWNLRSSKVDAAAGAIIIDSGRPVELIAEDILSHL